jgi:uncharacterized protein
MAAGLPDLVDCLHLAEDAAVLERVYELDELRRVKDVLADPRGTALAQFAFVKLASGRSGATVTVKSTPCLVCQRCMQNFDLPVSGGSEIEFAPDDDSPAGDPEREVVSMNTGLVSLRELAEEELLLALPVAPACSAPLTCGNAPDYASGVATAAAADDMRRPFSSLQDLLKKT